MKVIGARRPGGPEVLEILDRPTPHAGRGEVRVRVHAAAVSPADTLLRSGLATGGFIEMVPGLEAAGVVDEIGPGVDTGVAGGDRVMALLNPTRPQGGAYAQWVVLSATHVARAPAGSSHAEASTLPLSGLTARLALDGLALPVGAVVAVTGAAGAVGGHAVQLAKAGGFTVVADAAPADVELVRSLGADHVVPRGPEVAREITRVAPRGVDGIVDAALIGAALLPALRDGGGIAVLRSADEAGSSGRLAVRDRVRMHQVFVHRYEGDPTHLDRLRAAAENGAITMRVARVFPMNHAAEAHRLLEKGGVRGRIVLDLDERTRV